ncbi:MAG: hypothetical protein ACXIVQ_02770 [Acidimicrobiales bacterium]
MSEHDRLADTLRTAASEPDTAAVSDALGQVHARSHRRRRHQRVVRGGLAALTVVVLIAGVVTVAGLGGDDEQQVVVDEPGTTDPTVTTTTALPPWIQTTTTEATTSTTEAPPVAGFDALSDGVVGLELRTWFFGEEEPWFGFWRADDDLTQRVVADLVAPSASPAADDILDRATMRFELADGSVVFVEIDLESGWTDAGVALDRGLAEELRRGLDDAVARPWEPLDISEDNQQAPRAIRSAALHSHATPDAALAAILFEFDADRVADFERYLGAVVEGGSSPTLIVRSRGVGDDSGRGVDYRITLLATRSGYVIVAVESRWLCGRGVPSGPDYFCI